MTDSLRRRLRQLLADEGGIALPVALFAMISSMALAGAAVVATVDVQHGATRDSSSKSAIAAADAGANIARARQTRYSYVLNEKTPCLRVGAAGKLEPTVAEQVGGVAWCPAVSGTVGDASYVYRISPVGVACGSYELCIVSTGTADALSRRIEVTYNRSGFVKNTEETRHWEETKVRIELEIEQRQAQEENNTQEVKEIQEKLKKQREEEAKYLSAEGFVGRDGVTLTGNADIHMGVGTNGTITSSGNASVCGNIRHGIGKTWSHSGNAKQCSGYQVTEGNIELPSVSSFMPTNIATNNSDYRLVKCTSTGVPAGCQSDTYAAEKGNGSTWTSTTPWNPATRTISIAANSILTVGGGDYWVCAISFSGNSQLIMASGARVRFFFDAPENCGGVTTPLSLSGNSRIAATGYQPSVGQFSMPGFFFLGSTKTATSVNLSGNTSITNEMVIYGPNTKINISGNATWKGVVVGKEIEMSGNGHVMQDAGYELPPELNPYVPIEETKVGTEGTAGSGGKKRTAEEKQKEKETIVHEWEEEVLHKTNTAPISFTPQAYFECIGATPTGAPNSNC